MNSQLLNKRTTWEELIKVGASDVRIATSRPSTTRTHLCCVDCACIGVSFCALVDT